VQRGEGYADIPNDRHRSVVSPNNVGIYDCLFWVVIEIYRLADTPVWAAD
jgi:hypothetical protein